jgi:predicted MFS family arabinose efflux permease
MDQKKAPAYRWVIEVLLIFALFSQTLIWLAPAPILQPIIKDLGISLGSAGLIISVIALCISVFSFLGAIIAERLGALRAMLAGLWLLAIGAVLSGYSGSLGTLLACRVIEGIGFGVMIAPPGTLVMQWFAENEKEWPYINTVNALCGYIGLTAVFSMTPTIYFALGGDAAPGSSWRGVLRVYGLGVAVIALAWTLLGRSRQIAVPHTSAAVDAGGTSVLREVIAMRDVVLIAVGLFGGMWVFQLYTAFLPQYFQTYRGLSLTEASALTAVLPLTGMFAAFGGGIGTAMLGLRKPFTWPVAFTTLVGCIGAIVVPSAGGIRLSLVLVGIGSAGSLAALITLLMELPGMTPAKVGTGLALIWAVGYAGAFISPFLGGALAGSIGLRMVMLSFLVLQVLPIVCMYMIPETGPGRARIAIATAA